MVSVGEMGKRRRENEVRKSSSQQQQSQTLPSSPTHSLSSSSSSDFEFRISSSPNCKSSSHVDIDLCPADDLFYKGQLLPLHLSPRLSMVRTLLLAASSSSTSSSSPRDSTGSSNDSSTSSSLYGELVLLPDHHQYCDSSLPSSVADDDQVIKDYVVKTYNNCQQKKCSNKYFSSLAKFSSVFRRDHNKIKEQQQHAGEERSNCSVKRVSASAKEVIRKYLKKVKPFCDKLSNHHKQEEKIEVKTTKTMEQRSSTPILNSLKKDYINTSGGIGGCGGDHVRFSHSFSGNIVMYPQRRRCVSSCPSSMRSSPSHSQCSILSRNVDNNSSAVTESLSSWRVVNGGITSNSSASSMEELQSAIQGAIAHCKNSMIQKNNGSVISKEI